MNQVRIVLADPRFAANIGLVARACLNFGINELHLVSTTPERWHWEEAHKTAVASARRLLDEVRIHQHVSDAVADCHLVVGFTRRIGDDRRPELRPATLVNELKSRTHETVALVFGNEETGLSEDELRPCTQLCIIPTSPELPSMNLSHAVAAVLARLQEDVFLEHSPLAASLHLGDSSPKSPARATSRELHGLFSHWRELLVAAQMTQAGNPDRLLKRLEKIFHRSRLSSREIRVLRGILAKTLHQMKPRSSQIE
ncbi:MAG: tRNA (cytidine/uridine-2-O-)-methyltransferase TrmJ [Pseudomonadota bacterium]|jgi:TrmH family RNA methyltransferase